MKDSLRFRSAPALRVEKCPTDIEGLDEITGGGLPRGRATLVCGGAGSGKTVLAVEFLVRGATLHDEPGVFLTFEESPEKLARNAASLGFDLERLIARKKLAIEHVRMDPAEALETGSYSLDGLFARLAHSIKAIGATRVALDTLENLFAGLTDQTVLRSELARLFEWFTEHKVTAIVTAERGEHALTRIGLEEYVSDCVIVLDNRVNDQISTRRLRIVKYRGTDHGTNEYPFLIDEGLKVVPITGAVFEHKASTARLSSGIPRLDAMLGKKGYFRGSSILVSGTAGTGKSSMSGIFADATCRRGEKCLYWAFEEPRSQITRNMQSIGLHLEPWCQKGLLEFQAQPSTAHGLEMHLALMFKAIKIFKPRTVIIDPITNFISAGIAADVKSMLMRLLATLKKSTITCLMTSLAHGGADTDTEVMDIGVSSLIDTWIVLRSVGASGERNRILEIVKSRGMPHSNQLREFTLGRTGIELKDVYLGSGKVLTGSLRIAQEAKDRAEGRLLSEAVAHAELQLDQKRRTLEAQILALQSTFDAEESALRTSLGLSTQRAQRLLESRAQLGRSRGADAEPASDAGRRVRRNGAS